MGSFLNHDSVTSASSNAVLQSATTTMAATTATTATTTPLFPTSPPTITARHEHLLCFGVVAC
jgi:hypothetical protein